MNYSFFLYIIFCCHSDLFYKTHETRKNIYEYTRMCLLYLLLTDCQHFALSRKNDQKNDVFKKKNLNLEVNSKNFSWIKFYENPRFSRIKKEIPWKFHIFQIFPDNKHPVLLSTIIYYNLLPLFTITLLLLLAYLILFITIIYTYYCIIRYFQV